MKYSDLTLQEDCQVVACELEVQLLASLHRELPQSLNSPLPEHCRWFLKKSLQP